MGNEDFNKILYNIEKFRSKYYLFKGIRGILIVLLALFFSYISVISLEYFFYLSTAIRTVMFHSLLVFALILSVLYIFLPFLKFSGIIKKGNKSIVIELMGDFFPEVEDKLINVLELNEMKEENYSFSIIQAAIAQKSKELSVFNFSEAINPGNLKKLGIYFTVSVFVSLLILLINSSFLIEPGKRIVHYNQVYQKPAPFSFKLKNEKLLVRKGEKFNILVKCEGVDIPSMVYISVNGNNFLMKEMEENSFEYELPSVIQPIDFSFTDLKYSSEKFRLDVMAIPIVNNYETVIVPPSYTQLKESRYSNTGDLTIPKGSRVNWSFSCFDTDSLIIKIKAKDLVRGVKGENETFDVSYLFSDNTEYEILVKNEFTEYESIMKFTVQIVEDLYPEINIIPLEDSVLMTRFYFRGSIKDDYGFSKLLFHLGYEEKDTTFDIPFIKGLNDQNFYYSLDLMDFKSLSKDFKYYFSVTDNDQVNGPKSTISSTYSFSFPSEKELENEKDENFKNMEKLISESKKLTQDIQSNIKSLQLKSINNAVTDWEKNQLINDIVDDKNQLEKILENIAKMNRDGNNLQNTFDKHGKELELKQKEIEELLDDVMTDELKKLLDEFQKLAEEFNEKKFNELNSKMDISLDDLSEQLDRNLEMLKKFQIEQKLEKLIEKVDSLKKREDFNSEEILKTKNFEESLNRINEDIRDMEEISSDIDEIQNENEELKHPVIFDRFEKEQKDIREEMNNTKNALQKKNRKDSSEGMKRTSDKLENLSFSLKQMLKANSSENKGENVLTIKRILKNLLYISVNQEDIVKSISNINEIDPIFRAVKSKQRVLDEQFVVVKDSLYALAQRSPQIGNIVNEEILAATLNMKDAIKKLEESNIPQTIINQRMVITATNNLMLFLGDVVQQMENQGKEGGESECENGQGGKKMGGLKKSGGSIKDQLQKMIDQMKNGQGKNMSREMSEALMQHEMMQKMLRDLINSGSLGNDAKRGLQEIDRMLEQNRKEILNKNMNQQMIIRHNQIMTKLLESENSENERDFENKRESETADDMFYSNPAQFFEKNDVKKNTLENLKINPIKLTNFYLQKQRSYLERSLSNDR